MEIIVHRINKINELKNIPKNYGVEIDIRADGSNLILNHDPFKKGELLHDYLENFNHGTLILNIKESGIEDTVLKMVKKASIKSYFLLDIEMPYLYSSWKAKNKNIAIRYSEYENIEMAKFFQGIFDWVLIDTVTQLPINNDNISIISKYKSCLVCPERWGRKNDIKIYKKILNKLNYAPNAVMTSYECINLWK